MPDHHHRAKGEAVKCLETRAVAGPNFRLPQTAPVIFAAPPGVTPEAGSPGSVEAAVDAAKTALATAEGAIAKPDGRGDGSTSDNSPRGQEEPNFADPGYQPDGKQRYPIDTEQHLRAAWSYMNKPRNAGRYTAEQVRQIKAKIIAAWKEKIDSNGPSSGQGD